MDHVAGPAAGESGRDKLSPAGDFRVGSLIGPEPAVSRPKQIERDYYYMAIAEAVEQGADCLGSTVGAVLVLDNRVIGTGYNGTPTDFPNCRDGGCLRCRDSDLIKNGRASEATDPEHTSGKALDRCVCVHAEQNAFITAARFGIRVEGATLYTTQSPCFSCLKEAVQAGINRIVFKSWYAAHYSNELQALYWALVTHLTGGDGTRFEALGGQVPPIDDNAPPDPWTDDENEVLKPPDVAA
jgi:dCMP deaminase